MGWIVLVLLVKQAGKLVMKNRRQMACWLVVVAAGLAGCSDQAEKLQLENQNLQKENAALKKDLATVLKSLENSLSFPDGWASRTLHQEETNPARSRGETYPV